MTSEAVIEAKHRQNAFHLSDPDLDQLAVYVVLSGKRSGILVQDSFGSRDASLSITEYTLAEMDARLRTVLASPVLGQSVKTITAYLVDPASQASRDFALAYL